MPSPLIYRVPSSHPSTAQAQRLLLGSLLIAADILSFLPIAILGPAIGWPASLRAPAAVALGYSFYPLYSVLVLPVMVLLAWRICGNLARPIAVMVVAFAALSVLARSIGI